METTRELLGEEDLSIVNKYVENHGYMTIGQVREHFAQNTKDDYRGIESDDLMWIDLHIDYPIFITKDYIYNKDELTRTFPFDEFNTSPEKVFIRQQVVRYSGTEDFWHQDITNTDFTKVTDIIRKERCSSHAAAEVSVETALSKVYIGREEWKTFKLMKRLVSGMQNFLAIEGFSFRDASKALPLLMGQKKED